MDFTHRAGFDSRPGRHGGPVVIHLVLALSIAVAAVLALYTAVTPARAAAYEGPSGYAPGTIVVSQRQRRHHGSLRLHR